jgi:hypothetical protein
MTEWRMAKDRMAKTFSFVFYELSKYFAAAAKWRNF